MERKFQQEDLKEIIDVARGIKEGDLLIKNGKVINVFNESIEEKDVLIHNGIIAGIGDYSSAKEIIDANGYFISPSFVDAHVHIESSMMIPTEFAASIIPLGTTTIIADPHEISNVAGIPGLQFMMKASNNLPLDVYFMLSSCVPATNMETSGARLYVEDLTILKNNERVIGLAELMNYPGVLMKDQEVLDKIVAFRDRIIDGHAPGLSGKDLNAYLASGVMDDHECTNVSEALEKLSKGMWVMMREGSVTRNVQTLLPILNDKTKHRIMLCTDDKNPEDLLSEGHINYAISLLLKNGIHLPLAIRLATLNPSLFFGFLRKGGIAPGYEADVIIFKDISSIECVIKDGKPVASQGKPLFDTFVPSHDEAVKNTINMKPLTFEKIRVRQRGSKIRVIGIIPDAAVTEELLLEPKIEDGYVVSDTDRDIIKVAVIERHRATGRVGVGFIQGLGLKHGAFATSISHDSHNIIVAGENDKDMLLAVAQLESMGGGIAVAKDEKIIGSLPLPYAGLMTNISVHEIADILKRLNKTVAEENGISKVNPFMSLAFMSLAVIPKLKLTDMGLVDVDKFDFVDLFAEG